MVTQFNAYPLKPLNTIVPWCFRCPWIGPPWCRRTPVSRTDVRQIVVVSPFWLAIDVPNDLQTLNNFSSADISLQLNLLAFLYLEDVKCLIWHTVKWSINDKFPVFIISLQCTVASDWKDLHRLCCKFFGNLSSMWRAIYEPSIIMTYGTDHTS